ncbi:hypothetical protein [Streptomyces sp. NPDC098781]|uniref:hypothetical protein n=1 Tax=Streptomyces sp. NPDC098781 TaxID=3366097 RepID=UPI00382434C0
MRIRHTATATAIAALACALTACSSSDSGGNSDQDKAKPKASASEQEQTQEKQKDDALAAAGIPAEPTGADRARLLRAFTAINPALVMYEDKAIDAARNQCTAINGGGQRLDWAASQRFTYKDVTTTEAQGKLINEALKGLEFCKV